MKWKNSVIGKIAWQNLFIVGIAILVYIMIAISSNGYYHPDEHFQLIEFAGLKLGWNTPADLAWEYGAQIRPALQPMIAFGIFYILEKIGIDIYAQTLVLRLISAALSLFCISYFIRSFSRTIDGKYRIAYILLSFFLWFLPAINVRFSSESWAGSFLLLALACVYRKKEQAPIDCFVIGFILGLSFECRFQIALAILGLIGWIIWIARWHWKVWIFIFIGASLSISVCTLMDCCFYGTIVFTPFMYFQANILQDIASSFGVEPWYYYLEQILEKPTLLIGGCLGLSFCYSLALKGKNPVIWCLIPFLLIHSLIPHKELRFLFPVANFFPLLLIWGYEWLATLLNGKIKKLLVSAFCIINMGGLLMMVCKPAGYGQADMMRYVVGQYANTDIPVYVTPLGNPCLESCFLYARFYMDSRVNLEDYQEKVEKRSLFRSVNLDNSAAIVAEVEEAQKFFLHSHGFMEKYRSIPLWIEKMNRFYKVYNPEHTLILYSKENEKVHKK